MSHLFHQDLRNYSKGVPLLVMDFRVLAWKIYNTLESHFKDDDGNTMQVNQENMGDPNNQLLNWVRASWPLVINRGPSMIPLGSYTIIIADDNKNIEPYWRATELEKAGFPPYKGQRPPKTNAFNSVAKIGLSYLLNAGYHYISEPSYEADDIAGAVVHAKRSAQAAVRLGVATEQQAMLADRPVLLYTIDTDWLQLVGNGVWWCNTSIQEPRIRGEKEAITYVKHRLKSNVSNAQGIVDVKMQKGDRSDNLPPDSPRWAIDLMNPPAKYNLKNHTVYPKIVSAMFDTSNSIKNDHFEKAYRWLVSQGLPLSC